MSDLILNPPDKDIKSFGLLAYVDLAERQRVLHLPKPQQKNYTDYLAKRLTKEKEKAGIA